LLDELEASGAVGEIKRLPTAEFSDLPPWFRE